MNNTEITPEISIEDHSKTPSSFKKILQSMQEFASFSRVLRIIGSFIIIASMSSFLLQDWSIGNDTHRFYLMLGQTGLLAIAGLVLSFLLKEHKGGRVFFSLSLVSIAANMTTLGALIFSLVQWRGKLLSYPDFANWQMAGEGTLFIAIMSAVLVAVPIAAFAFSVMARQSAKRLTWLFIVSNSLLLLPLRDSLSIGILIAMGVVILCIFLRKPLSSQIDLKTFEGRLAIGLIFLPLVIMMVRSLWLYHVDDILYSILLSMLFIGLRMVSLITVYEQAVKKSIIDWCSVICAASLSTSLTNDITIIFSDHYFLSIFSGLFTCLMAHIAYHAGDKKSYFINIAGIGLIFAHLVQLMIWGSFIPSLLCFFAGIVIMLLAKTVAGKKLFIAGGVTAFIGLAFSLLDLFKDIHFNSWIFMTGIGIVIIISASLLERYGTAIKFKWSKWSEVE